MNAEFLAVLAERWCSPEWNRDVTRAPFGCELGGVPYAIVTSGHVLFAVANVEAPPLATVPATLGDVVSVPAAALVTVSTASLRDFCGPPEWPEPQVEDVEVDCTACKGRGRIRCECDCGHEHRAQCDECGGTGKTVLEEDEPKPRMQLIDGKLYNVRLIARALDGVADETVRVASIRSNNSSGKLEIVGDTWRCIISAMADFAREPDLPELLLADVQVAA